MYLTYVCVHLEISEKNIGNASTLTWKNQGTTGGVMTHEICKLADSMNKLVKAACSDHSYQVTSKLCEYSLRISEK